MGGARGFDSFKRVKGRKRHLLVDTEGFVLSAFVSAANFSNQKGARRLSKDYERKVQTSEALILCNRPAMLRRLARIKP